jgi:hypothetical protein
MPFDNSARSLQTGQRQADDLSNGFSRDIWQSQGWEEEGRPIGLPAEKSSIRQAVIYHTLICFGTDTG